MTELQMLLQHLKQPEYLHVLINPLPVYATVMAITALAISIFWLHKHAQVVSLILVVIACVSVWPVIHYGQAAYDRVYAMSDVAAQQWLDLHMKRAEQFQYLFYATALVAVAGVIAAWKWPRALKRLCWTVLVMSIASISVASWISHAGGQVRHAEFRAGLPPHPVAHEEEHDHGKGAMDHGAEKGKMDHGAMPGMQPGGEKGQAQPMQHAAGTQSPPTQEQLEASRLQLEASRLQLEASRKQLEAASGQPQKDGTSSPASPAGASPQQTQPSPSPDSDQHKHDP